MRHDANVNDRARVRLAVMPPTRTVDLTLAEP